MKTSFIIYCRAIGLYALLTLPAMYLPVMYFISIMYVVMYGWFAWFVFTLLYLPVSRLVYDFGMKLASLFVSVLIAVGFAYHMIGVLKVEEDVWHSEFIIFPFVAVIAGWISVCISGDRIRSASALKA